MVDRDFEKRLRTAKARSVSHGLMKAGRLVDELGIARFRQTTGADLRPAHTRLFPHIELQGTRITDLAGRLGVSKQAVSVWVDELCGMQVLERVPDPNDGRALLIRFCSQPGRNLLDGLQVLATVDRALQDALGKRAMEQLSGHLVRVLQVLEQRQAEDRDADSPSQK